MEYTISDRMAGLHPSAIREMFKLTGGNPNVVPFAAGNPSPDVFPIREIANITQLILNDSPVAALQYSITEGYDPLLAAVRRMLETREPGTIHELDQMIITTGAQQAIELSAKCLTNPGDVIICEDPSFIGALNSFRSFGARLVGVEMDANGMRMDMLEDALKKNKNARFIYTIPNFQNPGGCTLSLERRREMYRLACKYNVLIVEDNPYGELIYEGERLPNIKTLDDEGRVIYVGSFSKIVSPGLRVGYVLAREALISTYTVSKQTNDVHTTILSQMICERFLNTVNLVNHLSNTRRIYKAKRDLMVDTFHEKMSDILDFVVPAGGLFILCKLKNGVDSGAYCKAAAQQGVALVPGSTFLVDQNAKNSFFRVTFSTPTQEQVVRGIDILSKIRI